MMLINEDEVTPYDAHVSPDPKCTPNPGKTSRINVAHFMAEAAQIPVPGPDGRARCW